jgi:CheY-like chemotaxis protein
VKHIEYAARRAAELTRQMLACSGRGQFLVRPLAIGEVLRGKLPWIRASFPANVTVELTVADQLPCIDGDAEQIGQVLMHVLTNACEALGGHPGTVRIVSDVATCSRADLASPFLDEQLPDGRYVFIDVTDTGGGMTMDTVARMFEPFFTTKFTGRGLGLAATLGILRGHRGSVRVTSVVGGGTTIRLWFPAQAPQPATPLSPVVATARPAIPRGVLVIDDEETVRGVARTILERAGFAVMTAASGTEGIARFREAASQIGVVLLDLRLPAMSSRQVYEELIRLKPSIRIVLSSGYLEEEALSSFEPNQIAGFLPKPYRFDELINCVQRVVGGDNA